MNSLEKRSFYSFLGLYIISSSFFIVLAAYLYFNDKQDSLVHSQSLNREYIATSISQDIISAHMSSHSFSLASFKGSKIALFDIEGRLVEGGLSETFIPINPGSFKGKEYDFYVSDAPQEHLNIKFVVIQTPLLVKEMKALKQAVLLVMSMAIIIMVILAWVLSKLFMRPLHQKIKQVEDFVHDTAHELNTPITALSMSVSRALKKQVYDEKILNNIAISTKQLFDIYTALSYLSFESKEEESRSIDISQVLEKSLKYYEGLATSKRITLNLETESFEVNIDETKLTMLFGNLINNAIKYSHPNSKIDISFKDKVFSIQDYGIGIEENKISKIYEKYNRETEYAGGFGIGLSIVQKITQEYKLGLEVESKLGNGSCFRVSF